MYLLKRVLLAGVLCGQPGKQSISEPITYTPYYEENMIQLSWTRSERGTWCWWTECALGPTPQKVPDPLLLEQIQYLYDHFCLLHYDHPLAD